MRKRSRWRRSRASNGASTARAAEAVDGDEDGVPAAGPAEGRGGALHVGAALGGGGVVGRGDRALLRAEGLRRVAPRRLDVLRVDAAGGRQRVARPR